MAIAPMRMFSISIIFPFDFRSLYILPADIAAFKEKSRITIWEKKLDQKISSLLLSVEALCI